MKTVQKKADRNKIFYMSPLELEYYDKGVRLVSPHHMTGKGQPDHLKDCKKRGVIKGWSKHSRGRMRDFMISHGPAVGCQVWSVTLTVPGDSNLTGSERLKLWESFRKKCKSRGIALVWKLEVQRATGRNEIHWHLLCSCPPELKFKRGFVFPPEPWFKMVWKESLNELPPTRQTFGSGEWMISGRGDMCGALEHACKADRGDGFKWYQYMADHCSKSKQDQLPETRRQWGVVNRAYFHELTPEQAKYKYAVRVAYMRLLRKWARPKIRDSRCPFGWRHGWETRRGEKGKAVFFGNPDWFRRLAEYSELNPAILRTALSSMLADGSVS